MQTNPISNLSPTRPYSLLDPPSPAKSPQFPQETSPEGSPSKQRWKVLFLICSSTFGAYFIPHTLFCGSTEKYRAFGIAKRGDTEDLEAIMRYLYFIPIIAGIMIYRLGIFKTFRYFMLPVILGSLLTVFSFTVKSYSLYLLGVSLMKGSTLGLWVVQICMIIKWFKGKELSLAIGVLGFAKSINFVIAALIHDFLEDREKVGLLTILSFGIILCFLGGIIMISLNRIDMVAKQEEDERSMFSFDKTATIALVVTILCFKLGEKARSFYLSYIYYTVYSRSRAFYPVMSISEFFNYFGPIILLPLFGFFVDRKGGRRTTGVFSSFLMLLIGSIIFYFISSPNSDSNSEFVSIPITKPLIAAILFQVGSFLFEVCFWGILGSFTPKKVLGVTLGITESLLYYGPPLLIRFLPKSEKNVGLGPGVSLGLFLVIGIMSMLFAWLSLKKKEEEFSRIRGSESQTILPRVNDSESR